MKKVESSNEKLRVSVWRWYAPATLVNSSSNESVMPTGTLKKLLSVTGFASIDELMNAVNSAKRNAIPTALQKRLSHAFFVDISMCKDDPEFLFRGMELEAGGEMREVPYPLVPVSPIAAEIVVAGFGIEMATREKAQVHARVSVATNKFLSPRTTTDAAFIRAFFLGSVSLDDELEKGGNKTLSKWLKSSGFGPEAVSAALEDDDFRWALRDQILDRIDEIVGVCGAGEVTDKEGNNYVLDGDEEKGFSS